MTHWTNEDYLLGVLPKLLRKGFVCVMYPTAGQIKLKTHQWTQILLENASKGGRVVRERKGLQAYHLVGTSGSGHA